MKKKNHSSSSCLDCQFENIWSQRSIVWESYLVSHSETPLCFLKIGGQETLGLLTFRSLSRQIMSLDVSIFLCRWFCYKIRPVFQFYVNCSNKVYEDRVLTLKRTVRKEGSPIGRFRLLVFWPWREKHSKRKGKEFRVTQLFLWSSALCLLRGSWDIRNQCEVCFTASELKIIKYNSVKPKTQISKKKKNTWQMMFNIIC